MTVEITTAEQSGIGQGNKPCVLIKHNISNAEIVDLVRLAFLSGSSSFGAQLRGVMEHFGELSDPEQTGALLGWVLQVEGTKIGHHIHTDPRARDNEALRLHRSTGKEVTVHNVFAVRSGATRTVQEPVTEVVMFK